MSAFRPEAGTEYSRGPEASGGPETGLQGPSRLLPIALLVGGLAGSALLLAAEFTALLQVHSTASLRPIATVNTGSHHSYALIPIGLAALLFTVIIWRTRNRMALLGTGVLGVATVLIALVGDLPDAQAMGVLVHPYVLANATPSTGFFMETLGGALLVLTAGAGLLLLAAPAPRRARPLRPAQM